MTLNFTGGDRKKKKDGLHGFNLPPLEGEEKKLLRASSIKYLLSYFNNPMWLDVQPGRTLKDIQTIQVM